MSTSLGVTWYQHPEWFKLLFECGWGARPPKTLELSHPDSIRLPLLAGPKSGHWQGFSNYYTPLLQPVGCDEFHDLPGLARAWRRSGVSVLDLRPLDLDSIWLIELRSALRRAGYRTVETPAFVNWILKVNGQRSSDYLAARPGPLRTSLRRGRSRLTKAGDWEIQVHTSHGDALDSALHEYERVYANSWKPTEGSWPFIRRLARWMAERGELRLGLLTLNGEALAAQMWFVHGGVAFIFKLAHVTGCEAMSPGTVLTAHMMMHVIDIDCVHTVDFISGDDSYKRDWMSDRRRRVALLAFDPLTMRGAIQGLRLLALRQVN